MDEVFESSGAIDKPALKALSERSDRRGLMQLAVHLAAILASGVLLSEAWGSAWLLPALVLHGVLLAFLFAPLHETIHATAFRSRALNRGVRGLITWRHWGGPPVAILVNGNQFPNALAG